MHAYHVPKAGLEGLSEICTPWWLSLLMNPPGLPQWESPSLWDFSGTCMWEKNPQISKMCNCQEQLFLLSSTDLNQEEPAYKSEGSSASSEISQPFCAQQLLSRACDQPHGSCPPLRAHRGRRSECSSCPVPTLSACISEIHSLSALMLINN